MNRREIDTDKAVHFGDLVCLDAEDALATFMAGNVPDPHAFTRNVGDILEQTVRGRLRVPVRAYGEMVDVLWKRGRTDAAMSLEMLWNRLAATHHFALLCGYSMGNFYKRIDQFQQVCAQHSHVLETDSKVVPFELKSAVR